MSYSYSYSRGLYAGIALNGAIAAANPVYAPPFFSPAHQALVASGRVSIQGNRIGPRLIAILRVIADCPQASRLCECK
jgi:hypothetical protein